MGQLFLYDNPSNRLSLDGLKIIREKLPINQANSLIVRLELHLQNNKKRAAPK
jgi:hypothetical protein